MNVCNGTVEHTDGKNPFYDLYKSWQNHKSVLQLEWKEKRKPSNECEIDVKKKKETRQSNTTA